MRICKIWDSEYPWDVRAEKVSRALTEAGHEVHLLARNRTRLPRVEVRPEAKVHRLPAFPLGSIGRGLQFPAFFNPVWLHQIWNVARRERADLLLVRDLPLAPAVIVIGRMLGIPVVMDMAENYPAMMASIFDTGVSKPMDRVIRHPSVVGLVERWVIARVDRILVVVDESAERLGKLGVPSERITLVSNTPPLSRLAERRPATRESIPLKLVYLGLLEEPRGLSVLLRAVSLCQHAGVRVQVTIIGDGRERLKLERQARELQLDTAVVEFTGYLPNREALQLVEEADVGLVPHLATDSWNSTIPNKLFDYMAAGLPILTSDARPAARVVRETRTGIVYAHDDPAALAQAIMEITPYAVRNALSENGPTAVMEQYNWGNDAGRLVAAVEAVGNRPKAASSVD